MAKRKPDPMPQADFFALWDAAPEPTVDQTLLPGASMGPPPVPQEEPPPAAAPCSVASPEHVTANENEAKGQGADAPACEPKPTGLRRGPKPGGSTFGRDLGRLDARLLLRPPELAEMLGLTPSTLAKMRCTGKGPPFYKLTNQSVGYRRDEVLDWIDRRRRSSTWNHTG